MVAWIALGILLAAVVVIAMAGKRTYRGSGADNITVLPETFTDTTHHHHHHHHDVGGHHGGDFGGGHHH